ncbi:hypothetical protein KJ918_02265 [Patescibacteria group bacterium]|nr:hypothetical protein [Patescibacteria group bacterium]
MRKAILPVIILLFLLGVISFAQETELPDPGLTPDSPFYFLDTLAEKISLFFTFDIVKKAEKAFQFAGEKLAELEVMVKANKIDSLKKAGQKYQEFLDLANQKTKEAKEKGRNVEELAVLITEKTLKHQEVLIEVFEKVPEEAKAAIEKAIEVSRKGSEEAVKAVTGVKKEELLQKIEEVKTEVEERIKLRQILDETADWETYRNEEYRYEIKYPEDWESKERGLASALGHRDVIWIQSDKDSFSVDVWDFSVYSYNQLTEPPPGGIDPDTIEKKETTINGQPATELSYVAVGDGGSGAWRVKEIFVQKNQLLYIIKSCDSKKCDKILSTFKFIELEESEEEVLKEEVAAAPNTPMMLDIDVSTTAGSPYTISWRAVEEATNYILERDTNSSFSNPIIVSSRILNSFSGTLSPSVSTRYYFRVKACNKYGCSSWSKTTELWVEAPITVTFPSGGESINQESCKIQWDSKNVELMDIFLLTYDENKNQLICYRNPIRTGFTPLSEVPIAIFKKAARAEDGYYLASFKQELEENCSFVIPPSYYKIKLRDGFNNKIADTSDGYFTISPAPNFKIISVNNEVQLRGGVNPLNWENHTFTIGNDIILTDNSTKFYLDGKETTFEELKQLYDEMGKNKYCPFGSCLFNSLNGNIKAISSQGQITIMAKEMFFSGGQ